MRVAQIEEIKKLINENKFVGTDGAYEKFRDLIKNVKTSVGPYDPLKWGTQWRKGIYELGALFAEKDAGRFLEILNDELSRDILGENEVIEFIKSEIVSNYFQPDSKFAIEYFEELIRKYPANPEFRHTYSHYLDLSDPLKSISECRMAIKIEPNNKNFLGSCFNKEKSFFDKLFLEGKMEEAKVQLEKMGKYKPYNKDHVFNNILVLLEDRFKDYNVIQDRIQQIDNIINQKTEEERRRLIEVLGFFVAILGFIFTNVNIVLENGNFNEMLSLMLLMALIFLIFGISMSYIFQKDKKSFYKEGKFWILLLFLSSLVIIVA